jgi:hypothetical protein
MKRHVAFISLAAALVMATSAYARDPIANSPHVRPATPATTAFVADAQQKSETVRDLLQTLEKGNVVAYVHLASFESGPAGSAIQFVSSSNKQRFVLITINQALPADRQIALLGHELQHVTEVSRVSWVRDQAAMRSMLALFGWRDSTALIGFETTAAMTVERRVGRELATAGASRP